MNQSISCFTMKSKRKHIGWGNGYVVIPEGHPLHSVGQDDLRFLNVHGGVTFTQLGDHIPDEERTALNVKRSDWVIGFDTAKRGDNPFRQNKSYVMTHTLSLMRQVRVYGCLRQNMKAA